MRVDYKTPLRAFALAMDYRHAKDRGAIKTAAKHRHELVKLMNAVNSSNEFGHMGSSSAFKAKVRDNIKRGMAGTIRAAQKRRAKQVRLFRSHSRSYLLRKRKV